MGNIKLDERDLNELKNGKKVETVAEVKRMWNPNTYKIKRKGILKTEGGKIQFNAWCDVDFKENDIVYLKGALLKKFKGYMKLNINKGNTVKINPLEIPKNMKKKGEMGELVKEITPDELVESKSKKRKKDKRGFKYKEKSDLTDDILSNWK